MSELVVPRPKPLASAYIVVMLAGMLVGLAGIFLTFHQFIVVLTGLVVLTIALAKTEFALTLLVFIVPLTGFRVSVGPILVDAVTICTGIVIVSYAINNLGKRGERTSVPFAWAFLAFLFFAATSAIIASSTTEAIAGIIRYAGYFLLVVAIGRSIKSKESLTWILVMMVSAGALTGLYGIYQYLYLPHTATIGLYDLSQDVAARIDSTFDNPNFYAEYLVLLVPIGLALVLGSRGIFRRSAMAAATLLLFAGLILTYTRGSWMSAGIGMVLMSLLTEAWLFWVWVGLFIVALVAAPGVASRLMSMADLTGGTAGFRMKLWRIATGIIGEHIMLGIGIGNFYNAFTEYVFRHPQKSIGWVIYGAHNSYLTVWAEMGIFGLLSFVAVILISVKYGLYLARVKAHDKYLSWVNSALFAGVVGFSINSLTSNSFQHPQAAVFFWVLLGLQVAVAGLHPETTKAQTSPAIEGSLILRPFRSALVSFRAATLSHPLHGFTLKLGDIWRDTEAARWLYKEPVLPTFTDDSLIYRPVKESLETVRSYLDNSILLLIVRGILSRPFAATVLFMAVAIPIRALVETVIGR